MNKAIPWVFAMGVPRNPDLSDIASEPVPLDHICRVFGYQVATYSVGNLNELNRTIKFIGAIARLPQCAASPLIVHISVDGDLHGMEIGSDRVSWDRLTLMISEMFADLESHSCPVVLVLAARGACATELNGLLRKQVDSSLHVPRHVFLFVEPQANRIDTFLAWCLFYAEATEVDFAAHSLANLPSMHRLRSRLQRLGLGEIRYFGRNPAPR